MIYPIVFLHLFPEHIFSDLIALIVASTRVQSHRGDPSIVHGTNSNRGNVEVGTREVQIVLPTLPFHPFVGGINYARIRKIYT